MDKRRRTITLDIPPDHIAWLDDQAAANLCSRSAFVRQLIRRLMITAEPVPTRAREGRK